MSTEQEIIDRVESRHKCRTKVGEGPKPHKVSVEEYGHHASYVRDGWRIWGFVSAEGLAKFMAHYKLHQVR